MDGTPRREKPAPRAMMVSADYHLQDYGVLTRIALLDLDAQIGQRPQQTLIVGTHAIATDVVTVPRFVVIPCGSPERSQDPIKVVVIFSRNMFVDNLQASHCMVCSVRFGYHKRSNW
jgi:hypothetical protein